MQHTPMLKCDFNKAWVFSYRLNLLQFFRTLFWAAPSSASFIRALIIPERLCNFNSVFVMPDTVTELFHQILKLLIFLETCQMLSLAWKWLKYMVPRKIRSSHPKVFLGKGILKICSKFTGEHTYRVAISIKLQSNFIEITLRRGRSPVNLLHIFRIYFLKNTSWWLLLEDFQVYWNTTHVTGNELIWKMGKFSDNLVLWEVVLSNSSS